MNITNLGSMPDIKPLFVSGVYRSGTTFLTALIDAHPAYQTSSSSVKFMRFCFGKYGDMQDKQNRRNLIDETLLRIQSRWGLSFRKDDVEANLKQTSYAGIYDAIMRELLPDSKRDGVEWGEKLALQWDQIENFLRMFPDGKVLNILRDPRDVAASYKKMTYEPWPSFLDAAFNSVNCMITIEELSKKFTKKNFAVVRAEDIAREPEVEVKKICEFLEISFYDDMLDTKKYKKIAGEDWKTNTSFGESIIGFPDGSPRWPKHLSEAEVMMIELICQPMMSKFGYHGSGYSFTPNDLRAVAAFFDDEFLCNRLQNFLEKGLGAIGYRSDPIKTEISEVSEHLRKIQTSKLS